MTHIRYLIKLIFWGLVFGVPNAKNLAYGTPATDALMMDYFNIL